MEIEQIPRIFRELYADCLADDSRATRITTSGFMAGIIEDIARLTADVKRQEYACGIENAARIKAEAALTEHLKHVQQFLSDMYATLIDPCAEVGDEGTPKNVSEMCAQLLKAATEQREYLWSLPANWRVDSSLETWFPFTAKELESVKTERDEWKALATWIPIDAEHLPKVGDEIGCYVGVDCPVFDVASCGPDANFENLDAEGWTHFRPINAPAQPTDGGKEQP